MTQQSNNPAETEQDDDLAAIYAEIMVSDEPGDDLDAENQEPAEPNDLPDGEDEPIDDESAEEDAPGEGEDLDVPGEDEPAEANLSDDDSSEISSLKEKLKQAEHRAKSSQGRVGALTRTIEEQKKTSVDINSLKGKNLEELREDFPDLAAALGDVVTGLNSSIAGQNTKPLELMQEQAQRDFETDNEEVINLKKQTIAAKYGNWEDVWNSDEFATWFSDLPPTIKTSADSDNPEDLIYLLDSYNRDNPEKLMTTQSNRHRKNSVLDAHANSGRQSHAQRQKTHSDSNMAEIYADVMGGGD